MRQVFHIMSMLPSDSYLRRWYEYQGEYYPTGFDSDVYSGPINYSDLENIDKLGKFHSWRIFIKYNINILKVLGFQDLQVEQKFITDVDSWWIAFKKFTQEKTISSTRKDFATKEDFPVIFSDFLFSSYGARYKKCFKFNGTLECNKPAPYILASKFKL